MNEMTVKTSEKGWLQKVAEAYRAKTAVVIVDDAAVGIDPTRDSLVAMGKKARLSPTEWTAVAIGVGVAATGAYLVVLAILDPEPFSKIAFALGAGTAMVLGGGFSSIRVLTHEKPPNIRVTKAGIEISWD